MASGVDPRCVELLDTTCISAVNNSLNPSIAAFPLKPHIFFKLAGSANAVPQQQKTLTSVLTKAGGSKLRIARNEKEGEELWSIRKTLILSLLANFPGSEVISTDVCVPLSKLAGLIEQYKKDEDKINQELEANAEGGEPKKLASLVMGHVGDGNFHSLMYFPHFLVADKSAFEKGNPELKKKAQDLENSLVRNALALDGTSSGEHGVGIHKLVSSI
jgi:D-lactate dehydrogenase (cytochrome)